MILFLKRHGFKVTVIALCIIVAFLWAIQFTGQKEMPVLRSAPAFTMTNLDGRQISLADSHGKVRLVYFYYTSCPDVCPPTTFLLSEVQGLLKDQGSFGEDSAILSISFDPKVDTLERIRTWSQAFKPDYSGWFFLRGDEGETHKLAESFGIGVFKDKEGSFSHMNVIALLDREGDIRQYYRVNEQLTAEQIAKDMNQLVKE